MWDYLSKFKSVQYIDYYTKNYSHLGSAMVNVPETGKVKLQEILKSLDISPTKLTSIFRGGKENPETYDELGLLSVMDRKSFRQLANILDKEIRVWITEGGAIPYEPHHFFFYSVLPLDESKEIRKQEELETDKELLGLEMWNPTIEPARKILAE